MKIIKNNIVPLILILIEFLIRIFYILNESYWNTLNEFNRLFVLSYQLFFLWFILIIYGVIWKNKLSLILGIIWFLVILLIVIFGAKNGAFE